MGWATVTTRFDEVKVTASKRVRCTGCGKALRRSTTLTNTVNPFNKNEDGTVRTRAEIYGKLRAEARDWERVPVICDPCAQDVLDRVRAVFKDLGLTGPYGVLHLVGRVTETAEGRRAVLCLPFRGVPSAGDIESQAPELDERLGLEPGTVAVIELPRNCGYDLRLSKVPEA